MMRLGSPLLQTGFAILLTGCTVLAGAAHPKGVYTSVNSEELLPETRLAAAVIPTPQAAPDAYDKNPTQVRDLRAGPIHVKFQDGELRYLYVGEKEIARRLYFAVRDGNWNTAMPKFTRMEIHAQDDSFTVDLEAQCQSDAADYHWMGKIVGTADGTITFTAGGQPNKDFHSNRIGLCLLYGAPSLAGQRFETANAAGAIKGSVFPHLVSPTLVAEKFQALHYKIAQGRFNRMEVTGTLQGATFDMEDQRNWGDTSYKAYAPLPYAYPTVTQGDMKQETITLSVKHVPVLSPAPADVVTVRLGKILPHVHVPKIGIAAEGMAENNFDGLNMARDKQQGQPNRTWGINPSVHLPDEDSFIENLPTIVDQAATVRAFAPNIPLQIAPLRIRKLFDDGRRDPRNGSAFGAAWCAAMIKYLALAGVASANFDTGSGDALNLQKKMAAYEGSPVRETYIDSHGKRSYIEALAVEDKAGGKTHLWLINLSDQPQPVSYEQQTLTLSPYEVREMSSGTK